MSPAPVRLSAAASARIRRITVVTVLLLAAAAAVLSFTGLQTLAIDAGFPPALAWLFPVIIDGLVITGSLGVIAATLTGVSTWYPWMLTILGVSASVVGNVIAAPDDLVSQAVHATPPIVFALAVEGLLRVYRIEAVATMNAPPRAPRTPRTPTPPPAGDPAPLPTGAPALTTGTPLTNQGSPSSDAPNGGTVRERVTALLQAEPDITAAEVSRRLGTDPSHTRRIIREIRGTGTSTASGEERDRQDDEPSSVSVPD